MMDDVFFYGDKKHVQISFSEKKIVVSVRFEEAGVDDGAWFYHLLERKKRKPKEVVHCRPLPHGKSIYRTMLYSSHSAPLSKL